MALVYQVAEAETFEVGPGKEYESLNNVPWEGLGAGDIVEINYRDTAYKAKLILATSGTAASPIIIRGIPDAAGKLPVIDGAGATTRRQFQTWNEDRGVIKVGGSDVPAGPAAHIVIENLEVKGALPGNRFTDSLGASLPYLDNAAAIFIDEGDDITIRGCLLHGSANGLYVTHGASDVLVEKNEFKENGLPDSYVNHHAYTEADGIVFQYNRFGGYRTGSPGSAIEDHSVAPVIRYNWIEGGNHEISLLDSDVWFMDPAFGVAYVYGNVLIEADGDPGHFLVAWGGAGANLNYYRKGTLYFHHNTVLSARADKTTVFLLASEDESVDARNNILATTADGSTLAIANTDGVHELTANWIKDGYKQSHAAVFTGMLMESGTVGGPAAGFVDEAGRDVHLSQQSPCLDKGVALATDMPNEHRPTEQYADPRNGEPRPSMGEPDLGAYENPLGPDNGGGDDVGDPPPDDGDDPPPPPDMGEQAGGCGCHVGSRPTPGVAVLFALLALAFLRKRS